jgi:hypothetical protein
MYSGKLGLNAVTAEASHSSGRSEFSHISYIAQHLLLSEDAVASRA